ncbi:hypothetical protein [Streptomyces zingiberis]|uniref:Uncharacterized protein n=1 Tax=Streptomyces zingiberis TaxID=2053010 RepID=A0ABX1BX55_9ACTN|nr:hypothetical protein [Streptomyces zingiberis]NJQ01688.1 hypothetical protein [Streptomyces zingiberis]
MTEINEPLVQHPPVTVWPVTEGEPPFRLVEIHGEPAGKAGSLADVVTLAHDAGLAQVDLDDPAVVRWVGGGKYTWIPHHRLI